MTIKALVGLGSSAGFSGLLLGTFLSEDLACLAAGLLVAQGVCSFWTATLACLLGIFLGDLGLFLVGRYLGEPAIRKAPLRWLISEKQVRRSRRLFERRGGVIVLGARFAPGSRLPIYVAAGMLGLPLRRFCWYFGLGALLWTPALVGLATLFGDAMISAYQAYGLWALPSLFAGGLVLLALTRYLPLFFTWKGRRMLFSQWQRLTRWEFWPWWLIYLPVFGWLLWLGLVRHRRPLAFTAANPAMPHGGVVGESKAAILNGLKDVGNPLLPWKSLPAARSLEHWHETVAAFAGEQGWPLVVKPDVGERGMGVSICRDLAQAHEALAAAKGDQILQKFSPGAEYGVFYYRLPGEARGQVLGIVEKRFTGVVGDGRRTLERLILADGRAVCHAKYFFDQYADRLFEVPPAGERILLAELGTHSRGALFLDASHLITDKLEAEIDRISQSYAGFYFGRYDLRCKDETSLREGRGLAIVELNGVTSESTWMYDPRYGLTTAWRMLFRQWELAYAIGAANAQAGARVSTLRELWREVRRHR